MQDRLPGGSACSHVQPVEPGNINGVDHVAAVQISEMHHSTAQGGRHNTDGVDCVRTPA